MFLILISSFYNQWYEKIHKKKLLYINGLALCPNLHRAFDRGHLTIDESYKVVVANNVEENTDNSSSLKQFENKTIILPNNLSHYPKADNLLWHNENVFK
ncbi:HNH endonuclease [Dysgonomonas sp. ZJ279]|uniref:HNH endonuclease n=1 Tax=Dysgonomonas sp. ZJ279 TaxID=2709796 RepID=UPI0013EC66C9|nr:HNH endonuclease [Dysgonomonas sp. ZJ279]